MSRRRPARSLRAQLAALALLAMAPFAALEAWSLYTGAQREAQQARAQVSHLAEVTASETAKFIVQGRNILVGLAARPAVRALDARRCDPILADFLSLAPRFANVLTVDREGNVVCGARPLARQSHLRAAGEFLIGAAQKDATTGKWTLALAHPLHDAHGRVAGAVTLLIDLAKMPMLPSVTGLPPKTVVGIASSDGTVLAHSLEPGRFIGTNYGDQPQVRALVLARQGTSEGIGLDGIVRVRGYTPVPGTDWIAVASLPASDVYAPLRARIVRDALLALGTLGAAVLLAMRIGRAITRPMGVLGATAREVAAGNLAARAPLAGAREVAEVSAQFNRMLDALERANAECRHSEQAAKETERRLATLIGNLPGLAYRCRNDAAFTTEFVSDGIAALTGYPAREFREHRREFGALIHREDVLAVRAAIDGALARRQPFELTYRIVGADGAEKWLCEKGQGVFDAHGELLALEGFVIDISERIAAEARREAYAERLHRLSRRIVEVEESERRAISRELHDRIGQSLATLGLNLNLVRSRLPPQAPGDLAARLDDAQALLEATTCEARHLMAELHPPALEDFGLFAALRVHGEAFGKRTGLRVRVRGTERGARLAPSTELALFRIAQEALANAAKHARASRVELAFERTSAGASLTIADDGVGFEPHNGTRARPSWGLAIMRERAEAAGAALHIDSAPGRGTRVVAQLAPAAP